MRNLLMATAAIAIGFALPAAAANDQYGQQGYNQGQQGQQGYNRFGQGQSNQGQSNQGQGYQGSSGQQFGQQGSQGWQNQNMSSQGSSIRQHIYQDLSQAGFTDIKIMPRSFLVQAKDRDGNPVFMAVTPNSVTALTATPGQDRSSSSYGGSANNYGGNSNWSSGSTSMGSSGMSDSSHSGSSIGSSNGNGSYTR